MKVVVLCLKELQICEGKCWLRCRDFLTFNVRQEHSLTAFLPSSGPFQTPKSILSSPCWENCRTSCLGEWSSLLPLPCLHPFRWQSSSKGDLCPIWKGLFQGHQHPLVWVERHSDCGMFLTFYCPGTPWFIFSGSYHTTVSSKKISANLLSFHRSLSDNTELMEGSYASWIWISSFKLLWWMLKIKGNVLFCVH